MLAYKSRSRIWCCLGWGVNLMGYSPVQHAVQNELLSRDESPVGTPAIGNERLVLRPVAWVRAETTERIMESSDK